MSCTYIITPVFNDVFISCLKITPVSGWATRRYCIILLLIYSVSGIRSLKSPIQTQCFISFEGEGTIPKY